MNILLTVTKGVRILCGSVLAVVATVGNAVYANGDCVLFEGEGNIQFIGPLVPGPAPIAVGTVVYQFPNATVQGMVTGFLTSEPKYTSDGTIHLDITVQHDFSATDSLSWALKMVLSPTDVPGEFRLNEHNRLVAASGIYAEAFGKSGGHGTASFNTGQAQVFAKGRLCGTAI
jgi:hypothetical protein